jgi:hypothetical protein
LKKLSILLIFVILIPGSGFCLPFSVAFDPAQLWVNAGETFSVDLYAELPEEVISWDLNLTYDRGLFLFQGSKLGPSWDYNLSGPDSIGGFILDSAPVSGSDILLARLSFDVIGDITETMTSEISVNSDDVFVPLAGDAMLLGGGVFMDKGFTTPIGAAVPSYDITSAGSTEVTVAPVPEPSTLLLLGIGLIGAGMSTSRMRNKR